MLVLLRLRLLGKSSVDTSSQPTERDEEAEEEEEAALLILGRFCFVRALETRGFLFPRNGALQFLFLYPPSSMHGGSWVHSWGQQGDLGTTSGLFSVALIPLLKKSLCLMAPLGYRPLLLSALSPLHLTTLSWVWYSYSSQLSSTLIFTLWRLKGGVLAVLPLSAWGAAVTEDSSASVFIVFSGVGSFWHAAFASLLSVHLGSLSWSHCALSPGEHLVGCPVVLREG